MRAGATKPRGSDAIRRKRQGLPDTLFRARSEQARERAEGSEAEAELARTLGRFHERPALDRGALALFAGRFGSADLIRAEDIAAKSTGLPPLDAAAAAWALHNGALTGHASEVMPSADFRFVPLGSGSADVLALPAASAHGPRAGELATALARVWVQARDRLAAEGARQTREAVEGRERVRRALLAALGHDFRTPLTVLKAGLAELDGDAPARLGAEVDRLIRLSDDLIASAQLESGTPAVLEPVDLVDVIASVSAPRGDPAVRIESLVAADLPLVRADAVMLVHLLGNLLENAARHARSAVTLRAGQEGSRVRLDVDDDGEGIDPAIADRLFERGVTGSDRDDSSGLGLAIAQDLAAAMDARLSAGTLPAGGARFTLLLQACAGAEERAS